MNFADPSFILNAAVIGVGILISYNAQRNKNEIRQHLDEVKREIESKYVPDRLDSERRQTIVAKIEDTEEEIKRNRENIHQLQNNFATLLMGKLDRIETQLQDKVRRMTNIETRLESMDGVLHDFANRLLDVERERRNKA